jgi:formiminotetrahydrofolate cyclodeaminase
MAEDQAAYESLTMIRKLPADSSEKTDRLPAAILTCIRVPQSIGASAVAILELAARMVDCVNPYLLSDLAVSAELAMATARCAIYNCRVNLVDVPDAESRQSIESTMNQLQIRALRIIQDVIPKIWSRHQQTMQKR